MIYEFAIKKDEQNNGKIIYTPVVRQKKNKWLRFIPVPENNWNRITCIYGKYTLIPVDWEPELTFEECEAHIEGYKQTLIANKSEEIKASDLINHQDNIEI